MQYVAGIAADDISTNLVDSGPRVEALTPDVLKVVRDLVATAWKEPAA